MAAVSRASAAQSLMMRGESRRRRPLLSDLSVLRLTRRCGLKADGPTTSMILP
jgi:hypothetical protein